MKYIIALTFFTYSFLSQAQVQWATSVREFSTERATKQFGSIQALGRPNVLPVGGDSPCAWYPLRESSKKEEFIRVRFSNPLFVKQIFVAQSYHPGAITKLYIYDTNDGEHLIYENEDPTSSSKIAEIFTFTLEENSKYKVREVKVVLNTKAVDGYNAIDAIGISDVEIDPYTDLINIASHAEDISSAENLGNSVNSAYYEFMPQISPDGKSLYFSRRGHPENTGSPQMDDIWVSQLKGKNWTEAEKLPAPLNDKYPNSAYTITPDGNSLLLNNIYSKTGPPTQGVSYSFKSSEGWSFPIALTIDEFYNMGQYNEFFLASNKRILLMTLQREEGFGDNDIYVSFIKKDKTWSKPKNIGSIVNTAGIEASPFLAADNRTLYFSSDGYSGYGKRDIYMTKRLDDSWTKWSEPVNLGSKINTTEDESYYSIPASGEYAYFVSNKQTIGLSDIFRVKLPDDIKPLPVSLISGKVYNSKTQEIMEANIQYEFLPEGVQVGEAISDPSTGLFKIALPHDHLYGFRAEVQGYISVNNQLDLREEKHIDYEEKIVDLYLVPVEVGQKIRLHNVNFERSKGILLDHSYPELDRLVQTLKEYPLMTIRLEGHTDNTGYSDWNKKLSEERVEAVKNYLVNKGIKITRIETVGYGGSNPAYPNDTEENRTLNRRVEYEILTR